MTSIESVARLMALHARARVLFDQRRLERMRDREAAMAALDEEDLSEAQSQHRR